MDNQMRIMIADDHEIIVQGIKSVLEMEDDIKIVATAHHGNEVVDQVHSLIPDVLLLDMSMPQKDGMTILKEIKEAGFKTKVIILTVDNSPDTIEKAIDCGADGYVLKESTTVEIVEAIRTVYKGQKYLDKSLMQWMFQKYKKEEDTIFDELTKREIEILYYISLGHSNKEIADVLFLSEKTIKNNITKIFRKLEVKDRVHAAVLAVNNHIEKIFERD